MTLLEQASNLDFDSIDPYDTGHFPLYNIKSYIGENEYNQFVQNCNYLFLENSVSNEFNAGIQYEYLAQNTTEKAVKTYFQQMSDDEKVHGTMFEIIADKMFGEGTSNNIHLKYANLYKYHEFPTHENLLTIVLVYFFSETKVITAYSQFYSDCKEPLKKKFLSTFLAEESQHVVAMVGMLKHLAMKYTAEELVKISDTFFALVKGKKFLLLHHFKEVFQKMNMDVITLQKFYNDSTWHVEYLDKMDRKLFVAAEIMNPNLTFEQFVKRTDPFQ